MMAAESNVDIALEEMAREMRTGYLFCDGTGPNTGAAAPNAFCSAACSSADFATQPWTCQNLIEYYNANGDKVDYTLANGTLTRSVNRRPSSRYE